MEDGALHVNGHFDYLISLWGQEQSVFRNHSGSITTLYHLLPELVVNIVANIVRPTRSCRQTLPACLFTPPIFSEFSADSLSSSDKLTTSWCPWKTMGCPPPSLTGLKEAQVVHVRNLILRWQLTHILCWDKHLVYLSGESSFLHSSRLSALPQILSLLCKRNPCPGLLKFSYSLFFKKGTEDIDQNVHGEVNPS